MVVVRRSFPPKREAREGALILLWAVTDLQKKTSYSLEPVDMVCVVLPNFSTTRVCSFAFAF